MGILQSKEEEFKQILEARILESIFPLPSASVIKTPSRRPAKPSLHKVERITLYAQPIEGKNESVVSDRDGRVQITNTAEWPNSAHGLLTMNFKDTTRWGTGIMVGPNIVLTAGHNLYDHEHKEDADTKRMKFLPGISGDAAPFGSVEVEQYYVSPNYITEGKEDYGILILQKPIEEVTGYFGLACLEPEEIKARRVNVTGYPYDKVASRSSIYEMWGMEGTVSDVIQDRSLINYLIDTKPGQSGGGVWYQEGEDYYICGVHISGTWLVNTATLLTRAMYQQIYTWLKQARRQNLLFKLRDTKKLAFKHQEIDVECVYLLMNYKLESLTILNLSSNKIGDEGAKILAENTSWTNLSRLDLSSNDIGAGVEALAQNTSWVKLSHLNLSDNNINVEGAQALAENASWIKLSGLNLSQNNLNQEGARALAQNIYWINLTQLDLSRNNINEEEEALTPSTFWIDLSRSDFLWSQEAKGLAQNISWIKLSQLDLSHNKINEEGAKALAKNISWINLTRLDLSDNDIGREGAKALAENTSWVNLSWLDLSRNEIDAEGAKLLRQNKAWKGDIEIWGV